MADIKNNENEVVFTDIPSFEEINKRIDYSPLKEQRNQMIARRLLIKRIGIGFASVVLVVGGITGILYIRKTNNVDKIPFELGNYVYSSSIGDIDGVNFNESSNIILSEEEKSGLGTFTIKNDKADWVVYGQFYDCYFEDKEIVFQKFQSETYFYECEGYSLDFTFANKFDEINLKVRNSSNGTQKIFFQLKN